jgi:hypothetical protein
MDGFIDNYLQNSLPLALHDPDNQDQFKNQNQRKHQLARLQEQPKKYKYAEQTFVRDIDQNSLVS